ncbi:ribokinase [Sporosarcina gallistercoris]|uniref:Ribokinase n=1 Tax=Sporosarcina gallistercoris TaxID=2762245 RepID=A0ABR8PM96_9BACL|nr:ribokinase [Sporosarcina gallistercoris]MBD7909300.1 ribokinase [Sporosarcina gallistercoris]
MKKRIVVVGSLNMDIIISTNRLPQIGETILGNEVNYLPGGKGANQAVSIARLGGDVTMIGAVGQDEFGKSLLEQMENNEVNTAFIDQVEDIKTGIADIFHVNHDNCIVVVPGANFTLTPEKITPEMEQLIASADVLLTQLEIPLDTVQKVLEIASKHNVKSILNPAPAQTLPAEMLQLVDYLTPNETEFALLAEHPFNTDEELKDLMKKWQAAYDQTLIVTLGDQGSAYLQNGQLVITPTEKVEVIDTTGAGDSFNGALAISVAEEKTLPEMIAFATKVAARAVTKFGAQDGMPYAADLD